MSIVLACGCMFRFAECSILVTSGKGRFYSNGIDLNWLYQQQEGLEGIKKFVVLLHKTLARILTFPLVTVAALNGKCLLMCFGVKNSHPFSFSFNLPLSDRSQSTLLRKRTIPLLEAYHQAASPPPLTTASRLKYSKCSCSFVECYI